MFCFCLFLEEKAKVQKEPKRGNEMASVFANSMRLSESRAAPRVLVSPGFKEKHSVASTSAHVPKNVPCRPPGYLRDPFRIRCMEIADLARSERRYDVEKAAIVIMNSHLDMLRQGM